MAVVVRQFRSVPGPPNNAGQAIAFAAPPLAGSRLLAILTVRTIADPGGPAAGTLGWTRLSGAPYTNTGGNNGSGATWAKVAGVGESGSYVFDLGATMNGVHLIELTGADAVLGNVAAVSNLGDTFNSPILAAIGGAAPGLAVCHFTHAGGGHDDVVAGVGDRFVAAQAITLQARASVGPSFLIGTKAYVAGATVNVGGQDDSPYNGTWGGLLVLVPEAASSGGLRGEPGGGVW